jgi:type IV pilus assembly protein PilV
MMISPNRAPLRHRRPSAERGSFLLEALISVLIVAFGILGLIGLQARAIQNVDDSQYRGEAAYLANGLIGQMWVYDRTKLVTDFTGPGSGPGFTEFKALINQRLPGAATTAPTVLITPGTSANNYNVVINVFWQPPGDVQHKYQVSGTVAFNN